MTGTGGVQVLDELHRALAIRLEAFTARIDEVIGSLSNRAGPLIEALKVARSYPDAVRALVAEGLDDADAETVETVLGQHFRHLSFVTDVVENWLAASVDLQHEIALHRAVERESERLDLGQRRAVLSPGGSDNFVTSTLTLGDLLFGALPDASRPDQADDFVLIQVPRFEGVRPLWRPVVVGHEVAHLAVREHGSVDAFDLQDRFDWERARELAESSGVPDRRVEAWTHRLFTRGQHWVEELLCDAHAVRRFGPAGVAALAEFLTVVGALDKATPTHPPGWLRIRLLLAWAGRPSAPRLVRVLGPWQEVADRPAPSALSDVELALVEMLIDPAGYEAAIEDWSHRTEVDDREVTVDGLATALEAGLPGRLPLTIEDQTHEVTDSDVINAAWVGRAERFETPVARLAAKALEDLEFLRQWREADGTAETSGPVSATSSGRSVLSEGAIREKLGRGELVVTPLLDGAIQVSGVDVRLGNRFVVFQRSAVSSFDPIGETDDPRSLQRVVARHWGDHFVLHPGELVLASTLEYIRLPDDLSAQVITRSSYGRLGLITATAVQVNPHYRGCLTLELVNLGEVPVRLMPAERIAQLVFLRVDPSDEPEGQKYDYSTGPRFSSVRDDPEVGVLRRMRQRLGGPRP